MTRKLTQVLALEKGQKSITEKTRTELYKKVQKPALYEGQAREWERLSEDYESFPSEKTRVQAKAHVDLQEFCDVTAPWYDLVATRDSSNNYARANLVVDGVTLAQDVPVSTLLFLEKDLVHTKTFISALPVLDPSLVWSYDEDAEQWRSETQLTGRTKKVQKPIVLFPATPEHPAQTQLVQEDILIGHWKTTKQSGAITERRKRELLARVEKLIAAVRTAREAANIVDEARLDLGSSIYKYILG